MCIGASISLDSARCRYITFFKMFVEVLHWIEIRWIVAFTLIVQYKGALKFMSVAWYKKWFVDVVENTMLKEKIPQVSFLQVIIL